MDAKTISPALSQALERIFRPLARLLLAHGIPLQTAIEMLKQALISSAERDFSLDSKAQTDSRISLLTGVHRKDVKRLRLNPSARREAPPEISMGARLVSLWLSSAPYADEHETPLPLPRSRSLGGEKSFEALAERISKDIRPRALLDELLRVGAVTLGADEHVRLNAEAFIPRADAEEKLYYLGRTLGDHMEAASHNVTGTSQPYLDRIVHYDAVPASVVDDLRSAAGKSGMQALKSINRKVIDALQTESAGAPQRLTFGVYFFTEPAEPPETQGTPHEASS